MGYAETANGEYHAFLWDNNVMTDLGTLGGSLSRAWDINDSGQVVGYAKDAHGTLRAFLWENGTMIDLGAIATSYAYGINNLGQVVGEKIFPEPETGWQPGPYAFIWENGTLTDIVETRGSKARDINDITQVVGTLQAEREQAFLWENDTITYLGRFSGNRSEAFAINNSGKVVGRSRSGGGLDHIFLWEEGEMKDLGPGSGFGINDYDQVVGRSGSAFFWENDVLYNLHNLIAESSGWILSYARDINNSGQIVGRGYDSNGVWRGFLLTPIPEPSFMLVGGLLLLMVRRKRR